MDLEIETLKTLREKAKLKTARVAAEVDVIDGTVRNWENGKSEPTLKLEQVRQLMRLYNCDIDLLIEAKNNSKQFSKSKNSSRSKNSSKPKESSTLEN